MIARPDPQWPSSGARVVVAACFAATFATLAYFAWHPAGSFYVYDVPIAVPFALFVMERWAAASSKSRVALDTVVVILALSRVVYATPFVSGHVLFLAYATFTGQTRVSRGLSALVLAQVLFMKLVLWHDLRTPLGALVIAGLSSYARQRASEHDAR